MVKKAVRKSKRSVKKVDEYKEMKNRIIKVLTRVKVPRSTAELYVSAMQDQLIPKEIKKAKYSDIRKMFWDDIEYPFKEGY